MNQPTSTNCKNISLAWIDAMQRVNNSHDGELQPLVISVSSFRDSGPEESIPIRNILDAALQERKLYSCETVANTIFPQSMWNPEFNRQVLFERYMRILPQIKRSSPSNRYGIYFGRLIAYGDRERNQLEYIIRTFKGNNHRRSALQASIFDPYKDQTNQPVRGFPCLQQIAFAPDVKRGELAITGFYATQYIFDRAYGNYLGLCRLGRFVAKELGLHLTRMTCIASVAQRGKISKLAASQLLQQMAEFIPV